MYGEKKFCNLCGALAVRMDDSRILKAVFFDFKKGKRKSGGQFLQYRNVYKHHLFVDSWERQMGKSEARVSLLNQEAFNQEIRGTS